MRKSKFVTRRFFAMFLVSLNFALFASQEDSLMWSSVKVETEKGLSVHLIRSSESLKIESFILEKGGQNTQVSSKWFIDITQPLLSTLKITWGCSSLSYDDSGKLNEPSCTTQISFEFLEELEEEVIPDWYENPKAIFFIEDSVLRKRVIERKVSGGHWNLFRLDAEGNKSKGQVKVSEDC